LAFGGQAARNGVHDATGGMIDIGNTLRSARSRRGLELQECERETRIRARYLGALEDERFDILPEPAYARGFLRTYATFLGLDSRVLVEEYDDRFGVPHNPVEPSPTPTRRSRRRRMSLATTPARRRSGGRRKAGIVWLLIGVAGAGLLALWIGAAWHARSTPLTTPGAAAVATSGATGTAPATVTGPTTVRLAGSPGAGSRVTVRVGSSAGQILFAGVIPSGASRTFALTHTVWVGVSPVTGVSLFVDGRPAEIPGGARAVEIRTDGSVQGG
jgi:cytoskeleton protein RodZ